MTTNDTRTPRERAQEAALKAWPSPTFDPEARTMFRSGWLARDAEPTTITAEEHQEAASQLAYQDGYQWSSRDPGEQAYYLRVTKRVLAAINIRIEGDEA